MDYFFRMGFFATSQESIFKSNNLVYNVNKRAVIDFIQFLNHKSNRKLDHVMDEIIEDNRDALEELSK